MPTRTSDIQRKTEATRKLVQLVRAAQAGDADAFGILFEQFHECVFRVAKRLVKDDATADDVVADTFLKVMTRIGQLNEPAAFAGWLKTIATRQAQNVLSKRKRLIRGRRLVLHSELAAANVVADQPGPRKAAERAEMRELVNRQLRHLRELDRDTLEAFYLKEWSLRQMADEFGCPIGTIKRRLHVARKRLKESIEPTRLMVA